MRQKWISFGKGCAAMAAVLVLGSVLIPRPAKALFGEDIPVLLEQLAQLQMQYQNLVQQLKIAEQNILALGQKQTYLNLANNLLPRVGGLDSVSYASATVPLSTASLGHASTDYNYVTMSDDTAQKVISTSSDISNWENKNQQPASQWENLVYSQAPSDNTPVALQNLTNIGLTHLYHQNQAQIALMGILAQQVAVQNMKDRNEMAERMKFFTDISKYDATEGGAWTGAGEFLNSH
jgi:hypothetical protein